MYNVLLDASGEAKLGVGDMTIHSKIDPQMIQGKKEEILKAASIIILDGNLSEDAIHYALDIFQDSRKPLFFEPTDMKKAIKVRIFILFIKKLKRVKCVFFFISGDEFSLLFVTHIHFS